MLRAPGPNDPDLKFFLQQINASQRRLDAAIAEARRVPMTEPERSLRIQRYNAIQRQVNREFSSMEKSARVWSRTGIERYYKAGHTAAGAMLNVGYDFSLPHREAIAILQKDAFDDVATGLRSANRDLNSKIDRMHAMSDTDLLRHNKKMLQHFIEGSDQITTADRAAIRRAAAAGTSQQLLTGLLDVDDTAALIADDLFSRGVTIVDRANRQWGMETYTRMLARTKTAVAYNAGSLGKYLEEGVNRVRVFDGVLDDPECAAANDQIWTIRYAQNHVLQHPNCRRAFGPTQGAAVSHKATQEEIAATARKLTITATRLQQAYEVGRFIRNFSMNPGVVNLHTSMQTRVAMTLETEVFGTRKIESSIEQLERALESIIDPALVRLRLLSPEQVPAHVASDWSAVTSIVGRSRDDVFQRKEELQRAFPAPKGESIPPQDQHIVMQVQSLADDIKSGRLGGGGVDSNIDLGVHEALIRLLSDSTNAEDTEILGRALRRPGLSRGGDRSARLQAIKVDNLLPPSGDNSLWSFAEDLQDLGARAAADPVLRAQAEADLPQLLYSIMEASSMMGAASRWPTSYVVDNLTRLIAQDISALRHAEIREAFDFTGALGMVTYDSYRLSALEWESLTGSLMDASRLRGAGEGLGPDVMMKLMQDKGYVSSSWDMTDGFINTFQKLVGDLQDAQWVSFSDLNTTTLPSALADAGFSRVRQISGGGNIHGAITVVDEAMVVKVFDRNGISVGGPGHEAMVNWVAREMGLPSIPTTAVFDAANPQLSYKVSAFVEAGIQRTITSDRPVILVPMLKMTDTHTGNFAYTAGDQRLVFWDAEGALGPGAKVYAADDGSKLAEAYFRGGGEGYWTTADSTLPSPAQRWSAGRFVLDEVDPGTQWNGGGTQILVLTEKESDLVRRVLNMTPNDLVEEWIAEGVLVVDRLSADYGGMEALAGQLLDRWRVMVDGGVMVLDGQLPAASVLGTVIRVGDKVPSDVIFNGNQLQDAIVTSIWKDSLGRTRLQVLDTKSVVVPGKVAPILYLDELSLGRADSARVPSLVVPPRSPFGNYTTQLGPNPTQNPLARIPSAIAARLPGRIGRGLKPGVLFDVEVPVYSPEGFRIATTSKNPTLTIPPVLNRGAGFTVPVSEGTSVHVRRSPEAFAESINRFVGGIAPEYRPESYEVVEGLLDAGRDSTGKKRKALGLYDPKTNKVTMSMEAGVVRDIDGEIVGFSWDKFDTVLAHEIGHGVFDNVSKLSRERIRILEAKDLLQASEEITGLPNASWSELTKALRDRGKINRRQDVFDYLDRRVEARWSHAYQEQTELVELVNDLPPGPQRDWTSMSRIMEGDDFVAEFAADGIAAMQGAIPTRATFGIRLVEETTELAEQIEVVLPLLLRAEGNINATGLPIRVFRGSVGEGASAVRYAQDGENLIGVTVAPDAKPREVVRALLDQLDGYRPGNLAGVNPGEQVFYTRALDELANRYVKVLHDPDGVRVQLQGGVDEFDVLSPSVRARLEEAASSVRDGTVSQGAIRFDDDFLEALGKDLNALEMVGGRVPQWDIYINGEIPGWGEAIRRPGTSAAYWDARSGAISPPGISPTGDDFTNVIFWKMFFDSDVGEQFTRSIPGPQTILEDIVPAANRSADPGLRTRIGDRFSFERLTEHILDTRGVEDEIGFTGGLTVEVLTEKFPREGWAVAIKDAEEVVDAADFSPAVLRRFINKNRELLESDQYVLGAWYDHKKTGKVYLDVSKVYDDDVQAARFGIDNKQIAIFNLATTEERVLANRTVATYLDVYHHTAPIEDAVIPALSGVVTKLGVKLDVNVLTEDGLFAGIRLRGLDKLLGYKGLEQALESYHRLAYRVGTEYNYVKGRKGPVVDVNKSRVVDGRLEAVQDRLREVLRQAASVYEAGDVASVMRESRGQLLTRDLHRFYRNWHIRIRSMSRDLESVPLPGTRLFAVGREADEWFVRTSAAAAAMSPSLDAARNIDLAVNMAEYVSKRQQVRMSRPAAAWVRKEIEDTLSNYNLNNIPSRSKERVRTLQAALAALDDVTGRTASAIDNETLRLYLGSWYSSETIGMKYGAGEVGTKFFYNSLRVLEGRSTPHRELGASKVRSFYNNIIDPFDLLGMGDITVDFHMADASLWVRGFGGIGNIKNYARPDFDSPKTVDIALGMRAITAQAVRNLFDEVDPATGLTWAQRVDAQSYAEVQEVIWSIWREGKRQGWWGELLPVWRNPNAPRHKLPHYLKIGLVQSVLKEHMESLREV